MLVSIRNTRHDLDRDYVAGIAGSFFIGKVDHARRGVRTFDLRMLAAFALFVAFGMFCSWVGYFTPRQLGTFWPIYFMQVYTIAGLWAGYAFVAIGLGITALTLIGYFFAGDWFDLWMAFVDGGGLMLGDLWMRPELKRWPNSTTSSISRCACGSWRR